MKIVITEIKKYQQFYPYTVALVGAKTEHHLNYMACAWHSAFSFDPPLFGILISKKRFTHKLIQEAGEFSVNFLSFEKAKLSSRMGRKSGYEMDKVKEFKVSLSPSRIIQTPIIEEAYVCFECKLIDLKTYGDHDLFVGKVLVIHQEEKAFGADGVLEPKKVNPLLYLGSDFYITINPETLRHVLPD